MFKRSVLLLLVLVATACAAADPPDQIPSGDVVETAVLDQVTETGEPETAVSPISPTALPLPVIAAAPDWDNEVWINSDRPIRLTDVRGKVVLLEFWTFG